MRLELQAGDTITVPEGCRAQINGNEVIVEKEEKEEVWEFKDGDILTSKMGTVLIFKEDEGYGQFTSHYNTADFANSFWSISSFRHATDEEKQLLFDKLKEQDLRWNSDEKRVEQIRWRAEDGKGYCYIGNQGIIMIDKEAGHCVDEYRQRTFRDRELELLDTTESPIDWEQRRYEIAKEAMSGILSDESCVGYASVAAEYSENEKHTYPKAISRYAVACADALIAELKGGEEQHDKKS